VKVRDWLLKRNSALVLGSWLNCCRCFEPQSWPGLMKDVSDKFAIIALQNLKLQHRLVAARRNYWNKRLLQNGSLLLKNLFLYDFEGVRKLIFLLDRLCLNVRFSQLRVWLFFTASRCIISDGPRKAILRWESLSQIRIVFHVRWVLNGLAAV